MSYKIFHLFLFLCIIGIASCREQVDLTKAEATDLVSTSSKRKKTQALLLTQPFDFDPTNKNKVSGPYKVNSKITVPDNLATQSKWIMFEGPVLENEVIAYRFYADSRHRFDIFAKTVPDLVMDTVGWQYHDIMNWGSDVLKVGNSLGLGSPAIWYKDSLYTLSEANKKTIEVLENGDEKSVLRTTFERLKIADQELDLLQDWSIQAGQPWSEIHLKVLNGKLPESMQFATGIVKHLPEIENGETADYRYWSNWGKQSFHNENMGMAILAQKKFEPILVADEWSHAFAFQNADGEVIYRFLAAWERDNSRVKDAEGFKLLVNKCGR